MPPPPFRNSLPGLNPLVYRHCQPWLLNVLVYWPPQSVIFIFVAHSVTSFYQDWQASKEKQSNYCRNYDALWYKKSKGTTDTNTNRKRSAQSSALGDARLLALFSDANIYARDFTVGTAACCFPITGHRSLLLHQHLSLKITV